MAEQSRQLAAIMFIDIAGYTAIMQRDEQEALKLLNQFKDTLERLTPKHQGQIVQYFGDGCLLSFESSTQCVSCAMSLQREFNDTRLIPVRIGMHLGEVIFQNNNVFGDGVNIASRVESIGIPGAVLMSKSIRDQIKNKSDFQLVSLGSFEFKNVEEPMEVFALANKGLVVPDRQNLKGKVQVPGPDRRLQSTKMIRFIAVIFLGLLVAAGFYFLYQVLREKSDSSQLASIQSIKSIAVLPFSDLSQLQNQAYFNDGITEDIILHLSQITGLKVISRTSAFHYQGSRLTIPQIGMGMELFDHLP